MWCFLCNSVTKHGTTCYDWLCLIVKHTQVRVKLLRIKFASSSQTFQIYCRAQPWTMGWVSRVLLWIVRAYQTHKPTETFRIPDCQASKIFLQDVSRLTSSLEQARSEISAEQQSRAEEAAEAQRAQEELNLGCPKVGDGSKMVKICVKMYVSKYVKIIFGKRGKPMWWTWVSRQLFHMLALGHFFKQKAHLHCAILCPFRSWNMVEWHESKFSGFKCFSSAIRNYRMTVRKFVICTSTPRSRPRCVSEGQWRLNQGKQPRKSWHWLWKRLKNCTTPSLRLDSDSMILYV